MLYIYNSLLIISICILSPYIILKSIINKDFRRGMLQRLAFYPPQFSSPGKWEGTIWYHAASVGEVLASVQLLKMVKERWPAKRLVVSTFTPTGYLTAKEKTAADDVIFLPLDIRFVVKRALEKIKPSLIVVMETEIWPTLIDCANRRNVPFAIVNGRISDRSIKKYRLVRPLLKAALSKISLIAAQSEENGNRFVALGAPAEKVCNLGNLKSDAHVSGKPLHFLEDWPGPKIVAGSTRPGEEEIVADAYISLQRTYTELKLVIAPRHIERAQEIELMLNEKALEYERRSNIRGHAMSNVILMDSLGELSLVYNYADIVFIGGSLVPLGGHNMLEAALSGRPIIFGPHTENFAESASILIAAGGARIVRDKDDLENAVRLLMDDASLRSEMGEKAKNAVLKSRGASERTIQAILPLIED